MRRVKEQAAKNAPATVACTPATDIQGVAEKSSEPASTALTPTIFHEDWWLAAATDNQFQMVEVSSGGRTTGRLPYYIRKRQLYTELRMPPLTYFLGPAMDEGEGSENNRFLKRLDITRELLRQLPKTWSAYIKCHAGITDAIAFQQESYRTYAQFTHVIAPAPAEQIWKGMRNKTRNVIRRAEEELSVEELADPAQFSWLFDRNLAAKGMRNDLDCTAATRITAATLERKRGRIVAARDKAGNIQAANFCAWDATHSYFVMTTRGEVAANGAGSLLLWDAIKHAAARGLRFDFAGLGNSGTVLFYCGFGGVVAPRYVAVRTTRKSRLISECKGLFVPENFYY